MRATSSSDPFWRLLHCPPAPAPVLGPHVAPPSFALDPADALHDSSAPPDPDPATPGLACGDQGPLLPPVPPPGPSAVAVAVGAGFGGSVEVQAGICTQAELR